MAMFNYESEALYQLARGEALPSSPVYVAECKKEIIDEVSPNYPQLVDYEKELLNFAQNNYHPGTPVPLEYQEVNTYDYASVENAIPFNYKWAILKGQTLDNIVKKQEKPFSHSANGISQNNNLQLSYSLKANTTYTRFIHVSALDLGTTWDVGMYDALIGEDGSYSQYSYKVTSKGWLINTFTTKTTSVSPYMINPDSSALSNGLIYIEIDKFMIIEGDYTNVDIPYFEGMKSVQMPVLTTTGKNLFDTNSFFNDWKGKQPNHVFKGIVDGEEVLKIPNLDTHWDERMGFKIFVEKDVPLTLTIKCKKAGTSNTNAVLAIRHSDSSFMTIGGCDSDEWAERRLTFTPTRDYIAICSAYNTNDYFYIKDVQLEVGSTATPYEPFKSNILTVNEDVTLRSNGNICDELNLLTGQLTQRIGEDGEVLSQEVIKTVDLNQNIKPYEGTNNYQVSSDTIPPQLLLSVPVVSTGAKTLNDIIMEE